MTVSTPIFLAGVDRSGIGLLGELLEAHPEIAVTRRLNFWSFYYNRYGDLGQPEQFERCLADMMRYSRISRFEPQPEQIRSDFQAGPPTYARLFALLQEGNMRRLGKSRWADKSLNAEGDARTIFDAFPEALMVHIIRDPRDRYASQLTHRGRRKGKAGGAAALWLWSARMAERNVRDFPGRYKIVLYEEMVSRPESFLGDLCQFIGQDYSPRMLTVDPAAEPVTEPVAESSPVTGEQATRVERRFWTTSIGRFRDTLSARDIAFMQLSTGRRMAHYGYKPEPQQFSPSARAVYIIKDCPLNLARLVVARGQSAVRARLGRKPSARRLAKPAASHQPLAANR